MLEIEYLDYCEDVYDITVEDNHNFFANDILVHNCLEIALPTKPVYKDGSGEIALCTLAAFNVGIVEDHEYEELAELIVESLDNLLDYQSYPMEAARIGGQDRRALGVGVINYATFLAKNAVRYSDGSANDITHKLFETISYYLTKASVKLAKEKGACKLFHETKYSQGILPIDTYKSDIDEVVNVGLQHDWEELRADIKKYGMRNSTLMALMPSETSSVVSNSTNGIEPPRSRIVVKDSSDGNIKQVLPDIQDLSHRYETLWEITDNTGYLVLCGIMQKFVDQAISANTSYDPQRYEGGKVPMKVLLKDLTTAYKMGNKTLYYHNTRDGNDQDSSADDGCASGACKI